VIGIIFKFILLNYFEKEHILLILIFSYYYFIHLYKIYACLFKE